MKTLNKILNKTKKGLEIVILVYGFATLATFGLASLGIRATDAKYNIPDEKKVKLNESFFKGYNSHSLPIKALRFGEYLAYKLYQENLTRGNVEGERK